MSQRKIKRKNRPKRIKAIGIMPTARCNYDDCDHDKTYFRAITGQACPYCRRPLSWPGLAVPERNKYAHPSADCPQPTGAGG